MNDSTKPETSRLTSGRWDLRPLGALTARERGEFYDELSEDAGEAHFFSNDDQPNLYENPVLAVGFVMNDGSIVPAERLVKTSGLSGCRVDVYLERYFVFAMPGKIFDLQLAISSGHRFDDRADLERVSHTLVVHGVLGHYANYLGEPVFKGLKVTDELPLDFAVTFLTDRSTEHLVAFLKRPELQKGIQMVGSYNPIFGTVANYVRGVVEAIASAKKNTSITDAHVTLHTRPGTVSLPLVEGTYVFFQPSTKEEEESMARKPRYDSDRQRIVLEDGNFERNHMIVRIQRSK